MTGSFIFSDNNNVYWSTARSMARFGSFIYNNGNWNGTQILNTTYFNQMVNTSQNINLSYGYLWWLNGKSSFMVPQSQIVFPGTLMSNAPINTIMALGKNGQFLNVVPNTGIVWLRMGEAPTSNLPVDFILNNQIWEKINALTCNLSINDFNENRVGAYPNPVENILEINTNSKILNKSIYTIENKLIIEIKNNSKSLDFSNLQSGIYFLNVETVKGNEIIKIIKK